MKHFLKGFAFALSSLLLCASIARADEPKTLMFRTDVSNLPSLQRGARDFMNYCSGCHSLKYLRYSGMASDLQIPTDILKKNLMFTAKKPGGMMVSAMPAEAKKWFGQQPPDLSLETEVRGADWVYTYLLSFYLDPKQATGVNNTMLQGLAMPDVLGNLQGWQKPVMRTEEVKEEGGTVKKQVIDHFELVQPGKMSPQEYEAFAGDLTNFLAYAAEPIASERVSIGIRVMIYLVVLLALTYLLKKEFWRDVH